MCFIVYILSCQIFLYLYVYTNKYCFTLQTLSRPLSLPLSSLHIQAVESLRIISEDN